MAMDRAVALERSVLSRLEPVSEAITFGNSPVQQFYRDTTIFITGASGFIGKLLVEKLLRSCEIKKIYILLRAKRGKSIKDRLDVLLNQTAYDLLRETQPKFAEKIIPIEGDVSHNRLGITDKNWLLLTEEVNVIFHVAATIRFDEPLKLATLTNVRGTMETLDLGKACINLKSFIHVSTSYAHATINHINNDVEEKFYQSPVPPEVIVGMIENMDDDKINAITPQLIHGWPNTYSFTKAIAEEVIRTRSGDMPVCVVKPPLVTCACVEPAPGWVDMHTCFSSPTGLILSIGMGITHVLLVNRDTVVSYAPVDYVNNAMIIAGWDVAQNKRNQQEPPLYTLSSTGCNTKWRFFSDIMRSDRVLSLSTPKAVWYCGCIETTRIWLFWILTWLFHYIPGYVLDTFVDLIGIRQKYNIPSLIKIYTKMYKLSLLYTYFVFNTWNFRDDNLQAMISRLSPEDRIIYNCNIKDIDFGEQFQMWCVGIRRYVIKDGLKDSDSAFQRQKTIFKYLNYTFLMAYAYIIYFGVCFVFKLFTYVLNCVFY